jgi:hypothetical protein
MLAYIEGVIIRFLARRKISGALVDGTILAIGLLFVVFGIVQTMMNRLLH